MQFFTMMLFAGILLFSACSKEEPEFVPQNNVNTEMKTTPNGTPAQSLKGWKDEFLSASSLSDRWHLFGTPQPQWVNYACGRFGVFDNNGRTPEGSYAISKTTIGNKNGYTLEAEVCIDLKNSRGAFISPEIGVTRKPFVAVEPNTIVAGMSMQLIYIGKDIPGVPPILQDHTYVVMSALADEGAIGNGNGEDEYISSGKYAFVTDYAGNGWHTMKIVLNGARQVAFYLDGQLIWKPKDKVHPTLLKGKNVMLGFTSPGSYGKAYHDYVKVSYPLPDEIVNTVEAEAGN